MWKRGSFQPQFTKKEGAAPCIASRLSSLVGCRYKLPGWIPVHSRGATAAAVNTGRGLVGVGTVIMMSAPKWVSRNFFRMG